MDSANLLTEQEYPPEILELIEEMKAIRAMKLEALGKAIAKSRDEAVKERRASGIEVIWEEDLEHYDGIYAGNRAATRWNKSAGVEGGLSKTGSGEVGYQSTAFFNLTRQFCDAASARMGDILLPAGDWNFAVKPTPVQDAADEQAAPAVVGAPNQPAPLMINQQQKDAEARAEKAEAKIHDWLVECNYHTEVRKVIEDSSILGTGILKGPCAERRVKKKATPDGLEMVISTEPGSTRIDPWDFFPDPACGENIHCGNYVLERDRLTAKQLRELKSLPSYLSEAIDQVLDEGPSKKNYNDGQRQNDLHTKDDDRFDVWYYYGNVSIDDLGAAKVDLEGKHEKDVLPAVVTLVNDTVIKAFINPLDTGEFPYDVFPWQRRAGSPWGMGVARQGRTPQLMINAAGRALMENAGLGSGPQIVIRQNAVFPADGSWQITPRKIWLATEQADTRSVGDAFMSVNIPMLTQELMSIMEQGRKMMEESTGIFFIMQGQQGSAPDTVGGMELLHRNASAILRRQARTFDEKLTEPHIKRYYDWLMLYGPEDCKGDLMIEAVGSSALVEREIQAMFAQQLLQLSVNPVFEIDPAKAMIEVLKAQRFSPDKFLLTDEKKQQLAQQQPMIPAIEVAKIRAESDKLALQHDAWKTQVTTQTAIHRAEVDTDRDVLYNNSLKERDVATAQLRREELQLKKEIALLDYATKKGIAMDQVKSNLAKTAMTLREQRALAMMTMRGKAGTAPQVATPAAEPPGRAPVGEAFQK